MRVRSTPPEDVDLADWQFGALNEQFYRSSPKSYFDKRIRSLMLVSSHADGIRDAARAGINLGKFSMRDDPDELFDEDGVRDFISVEAMALQQHACEAFLRLFLAHRGLPLCPWLDVARLRNFAVFHRAVDGLSDELGSAALLEDLRLVLRGSSEEPMRLTDDPALDWNADGEELMRLLGEVLSVSQDHQNAYNATKHGLAVIPSELGIDLSGGEDVGALLTRSGPSLTWLEAREQDPSVGKRWQKTTRWIDADAFLTLTFLVIDQLDNLWEVARSRYLGTEAVTIRAVPCEALDELDRLRTGGGYGIAEYAEQLYYEGVPPDEESVAGSESD
jgi:hypothetical protein